MTYPKAKVKKVFKKVVKDGIPVSIAMKEEGYADNTAKNPKNITESKGWKELMEEHLSEASLSKKHEELLNATKLDHMIFPLGPKEEDKQPEILDEKVNAIVAAQAEMERTHLTDKDITQLLTDANCVVRKIVHGRTARHVYFWAFDNKARKDALDMAYKLRGSYAPDKSINVNLDSTIPTEKLLELANRLNETTRALHPGGSGSSDGASSNLVGAEVSTKDE